MAVTAELESRLLIRFGPSGDLQGGPTGGAEVATKKTLLYGASADQIHKGWHDTRTLGAGATEDLDLQAQTDQYGVALGLAGVVALRLCADAANTAEITFEPAAANGWTAFIGAVGDIINLEPGMVVHVECTPAADLLVDATHKVITVTNTSGAAGNTYTISLVGRTS